MNKTSLPKKYYKYIGERVNPYGESMYVIYFVRKDNRKDTCGYREYNSRMNLIKSCYLEALDKFKQPPKDWQEIEPVFLKGVMYDRQG